MNTKHTKLFTILLTSTLLFTSCYQWFEEKVEMDHSSKQSTLSDLFHQDPEITGLTTPTQVLASKGLYSGSVKVNWSAVPNASSYRIERAVVKADESGIPDEGDFQVVEKYFYKTTYVDTILSNPTYSNEEYGNKYYYRISAENINKGYESSEFTSISSKETEGLGWLLPAPKKLDAWKGKSTEQVKLTWEGVDKALNYVIYRGTNPSGSGMEKLATILGGNLSYSDNINESEQGTNFYYKVCAKLANGSESAFTSLAMGYSLKKGAPKCPEGICVENGLGDSTSSITVKWNAVANADGSEMTYSLYRTSSVDSVYTLIESNISGDTTSKTVTEGLKPGITYYFYLQTVKKNGDDILKSAFSETGPEIDGKTNTDAVYGFLLSPPSEVEVVDSINSGKIFVRWTPAVGSTEPGVSYTYKIYYSDSENGSYTETTTQPPAGLGVSSDGYYEFEVDKHNFFKVSTIKTAESALSFAAAPTPSAPNNVYATKCVGGDLIKLSTSVNEVYPVKITWQKPSNDNPYGYYVYRSTKPDSSFRKLTEDPILSTDPLEFIDENETARPGSFYYYKVVSLNSLLQGRKSNNPASDPSGNARGYGAITRDQWFREYNKTIMKSQSKLSLMHKAKDTDKLGSETINGDLSGTLYYNAAIAGLGAEIVMHYENYSDFNTSFGKYFVLTGNTDTTSNMSANGNMHGTVQCSGMYPGSATYDNLQIKGGAAGGGSYDVETRDLSGNVIFPKGTVNWTVGEE